MLRLCRSCLHWVRNSVFEGEVTEVKLKEFVLEAQKIMDIDYDSLLLFKNRSANWLDKEVIGVEKSGTDKFL